ncbi:MAG: class IV adenylate cyclase [Candidatus Moranbacteria bacterium]|nr:class IV adenylate cyclase [Candidatus Moranbacteria bacterium]
MPILCSDMKEIEIKARIRDIDTLTGVLAAKGFVFGEPAVQNDVIFLPAGIEFPEITKGVPVVRVRNADGVFTLTLKMRVIAGKELIKLEKEVNVSDDKTAIEIVSLMGFHEVIRVGKKRMECEHDGVTVCIDDVTGLGAFIEVERLSEGENGEAVQEDLKAFLLSLGIGTDDIVTKGYDTLLCGKGI